MKGNLENMTAMIAEVNRVQAGKKDFVKTVGKDIRMSDNDHFEILGESYAINQIAHEQIVQRYKIPSKYYTACKT